MTGGFFASASAGTWMILPPVLRSFLSLTMNVEVISRYFVLTI